MSDKYQKAIEFLTQHPLSIYDAWNSPGRHPAGCLFQYATSDGQFSTRFHKCGCLSMIRDGWNAETEALTEKIRADERIPKSPEEITVDDLPIFAEWQARIDRELRCKNPTL